MLPFIFDINSCDNDYTNIDEKALLHNSFFWVIPQFQQEEVAKTKI